MLARFKTHLLVPFIPTTTNYCFCLNDWEHLSLRFTVTLLILCLPCSSHSGLWTPKSKWLPHVPSIKFNCVVVACEPLHTSSCSPFQPLLMPVSVINPPQHLHPPPCPSTIGHTKLFPSLGALHPEHSAFYPTGSSFISQLTCPLLREDFFFWPFVQGNGYPTPTFLPRLCCLQNTQLPESLSPVNLFLPVFFCMCVFAECKYHLYLFSSLLVL